MLQFLPVRDPGRLVLFYDGIKTGVYSGGDLRGEEFSYEFYEYLKSHNGSFEDLSAFRQGTDRVILHVSGGKDSGPWERAKVHLVSANYFEVLGVSAATGRVLQPSDDSPAAPPAAVLSYPFWRDRFQSKPSIVGQTVVLNGTVFTVVGVAAQEFFGERIENPPEFFLPLSVQPQILKSDSFLTAHDVYWLNFFGRLKPGVSLSSAQAAVNVRLHQFYLDRAGSSISAEARRKIQEVQIRLKPGGGGISGLRYLYSQPLHLLMAVVAVVLLIACANVATLQLARASARRPEFLARLALGASRNRLLRQVLTESLLLSLIGGAVGVGFAWWSVKLLVLLIHVGSFVKVRPDPIVMAFTFGLCLLTGVLFGIFPALKFSRMELRPGNPSSSLLPGRWRFSGAQALIALQIALSLILLVGAGLLVHSLFALETQNIGFQRENVLVIRTNASLAGYAPNELFPLYRNLGDRLSHLPGVVYAALGRFTPLSGYSSSGNFSMEGYNPPAGLKLNVYDVPIGPQFFETLSTPILLGRTITPRDTPASPAVAVVNQTFVRLYLADQNPLGHRMILGAPFKSPGAEIVGVVADSTFYDLHEKAPPMVFFSLWQKPAREIEAVLRTRASPLDTVAEVREAFRQTNGRLPILDALTLNSQIEKSLNQQKVITILCSVFGSLALILASVGIYGTLAYSVAGRTKEIGVRMAIGAQRRNVTWLILRHSVVLTGFGLVLGLPLAMGGTYWIKSFLFGVGPLDPLAIGSAVLLILALAMLAGYLPARRAIRVDPVRALRQE